MVQSNATATLGSETAPPPAQSVTTPGLPVAWVFDGADPDGRPLVRRPPLDPAELQAISHYLRNAPMVMAPGPAEQDQLDPRRGNVVPATWHTDGDWIWAGSIDYYLQVHGLPPQPELVAHMRRHSFTIPIVTAERRQVALAVIGGAPIPTPRPSAETPPAPAEPAAAEIPEAPAEPDAGEPVAEQPRVEAAPGPVDSVVAAPAEPELQMVQAGTDSPELKTALLRAKAAVTDFGIDPERICIDGERDGALCLCRDGERWLVYTKRGDRRKGAAFDTVHDAVDFFVGHLYLRQEEYQPNGVPA
jgi:hypothetical protein